MVMVIVCTSVVVAGGQETFAGFVSWSLEYFGQLTVKKAHVKWRMRNLQAILVGQ